MSLKTNIYFRIIEKKRGNKLVFVSTKIPNLSEQIVLDNVYWTYIVLLVLTTKMLIFCHKSDFLQILLSLQPNVV